MFGPEPPDLAQPTAYCDTSPPPTTPAVLLSWTPVEGASSYDLFRDGELYAYGLTGTTFENEANVVAGRSYTYTVKARMASSEIVRSKAMSVAVPADVCPLPPQVAILDPPEAHCEPGGTPRIELSWSPSNAGVTYDLFRNGAPYASRLTGTTYQNTANVVPGNTYTYFVRTRSASGIADSPSRSLTVDPNLCGTRPAAVRIERPRIVCDESAQRYVAISWPAVAGAESYDIYREESGTPWGSVRVATQLNVTQHWDPVDSLKTYTYVVRAWNASGPNDSAPASIWIPLGSCPRINYVVLGDSISSGEGIGEYFAPDLSQLALASAPTRGFNRCHRSRMSFAAKVHPRGFLSPALAIRDSLDGTPILACSGAKSVNVLSALDGGKRQGNYDLETSLLEATQLDRSYDGQLVVNDDVDLITITIGANDLGFAEIATECVLNDCVNETRFNNRTQALAPFRASIVPQQASKIAHALRMVRAQAESATVLALGYPRVVAGTTECPSLRITGSGEVDVDEQEELRLLADDLNDLIMEVAEEVGVFFVPIAPTDASLEKLPEFTHDAFKGYELCSGGAEWFNPLARTGQERLHPNRGSPYSSAINNFLNRTMSKPGVQLNPSGLPANPEPADSQPTMRASGGAPLVESLGALRIEPVRSFVCPLQGFALAGQSLRVVGDGFAAQSSVQVDLTLPSQEVFVALGSFQVDSNGTLDASVALPVDVGDQLLFFVEAHGQGSDGAPLRLVEPVRVSASFDEDRDGDGIPDVCDTCPDVPGELQADTDGDGLGDLCDPFPYDRANDVDNDGLGADVDPCPFDSANDADQDGVCESDDNCPTVWNPSQFDADGDGVGNACDGDLNDDGLRDENDLAILDACMAAGAVDPSAEDPTCDQSDLDGDGDVDAIDRQMLEALLAQTRQLGGALYSVSRPIPEIAQEIGGFSIESHGADDVRAAPDLLTMTTTTGSLAGRHIASASVRNVDPSSGRPRRGHSTGSCSTGFEPACLPILSNFSIGPLDPQAHDPLRNSGEFAAAPPLGEATKTFDPSNLAVAYPVFEAICDTSRGYAPVDRRVCGLTIWNSKVPLIGGLGFDAPDDERKSGTGSLTSASLLANSLAGNAQARTVIRAQVTRNVAIPYVRLNGDVCDGFLSNGDGASCSAIPGRGPVEAFIAGASLGQPNLSLNEVLTDEQEALLGCGPYWGTDCESDGIDFLNAEASVLLQSFPGFAGEHGDFIEEHGFDSYSIGGLDDNGVPLPVPGTSAFVGPAPGSRSSESGVRIVAGARDPGDPNYNASVDGSGTGLVVPQITGALQPHDFGPAAGLAFKSEMAALSWNLMMTLVAYSRAPVRENPAADEFASDDPMSTTPGQCSFAQPHHCRLVKNIATQLLTDDPRDVPRLRWDWEASHAFAITDATGDLAEFQGGIAYSIGPESIQTMEGEAGVAMFLEPPPGITPPVGALVGAFGPGPDQIPETEDDAGRRYGVAYGIATIPEPSGIASSFIAMSLVAALKRRRAVCR